MTRRNGLAVVLGSWTLMGAWAALFFWPVYAGVVWLVALFALMVYAALFVWPSQTDAGNALPRCNAVTHKPAKETK
jgi:hypothetical protein